MITPSTVSMKHKGCEEPYLFTFCPFCTAFLFDPNSNNIIVLIILYKVNILLFSKIPQLLLIQFLFFIILKIFSLKFHLLIFQISLSLSSSLLSEAKTDKYRDLRALLQLLSSLCSKDMVRIFFVNYLDQQLERYYLSLIHILNIGAT